MALIAITSAGDPRIAAYRAVRERDLASLNGREGEGARTGLFVVEGEVVLRTAARLGRFPIESVLLADKRVDALADVIALLGPQVPVHTASQAVMDAIAGFPIHRGILALGRRTSPPSAANLLADMPKQALTVCLFGVGNHDNMGGVFRNAAAFGADAILLGADCCDPLYRKAIRVSVGAALTVPFAWFADGEDPLITLRAAGFEALALSPSGAEPLHKIARPPRAALLLGSEGPGLDAKMLASARTVSVPMSGGFDSLNLATTSGVALYQLTRS